MKESNVLCPCEQCNYQSTKKGSLSEHKRAVHERVKYPGRQYINQHQKDILHNTKGQHMKELDYHAGIVEKKQYLEIQTQNLTQS